MLSTFRKSWSALRRSRPGKRFQDAYDRSQKYRRHASLWQKVLVRGASILSLIVGVFFVFVPGPGIPFLFLGAALLARESLRLAMALDWIEVKLRALFHPLHRWWKKKKFFHRGTTHRPRAHRGAT